MRLFDVLMFPTWNRGQVIRSSDFVPARLIQFIDEVGALVQASVWSEAPGGTFWVVPLDRPDRAFVRVRRAAHRYVIAPEKSPDSSP